MSFLTPLYLAGAALIALPIVLHLLRRDVAPPVPFTAVSLLRKTPGRSLAAASAARPAAAGGARRGAAAARRLVRASVPRRRAADRRGRRSSPSIDRSAWRRRRASSARARRWRARRSTRRSGDRIVARRVRRSRRRVSAAGTAADARAALAAVDAGLRRDALCRRVRQGGRAPAGRGATARLVVVTDLQRSGFDENGAVLPEGIDLAVRDAGAATANLSVANADDRSAPGRRDRPQLRRRGRGRPTCRSSPTIGRCRRSA